MAHVTISNNTGAGSAVLLWWTHATMTNTIIAGNSDDTVLTGAGGTFTAQSAHNLLGAASATGLANGSNGNQLGVPVSALLLGSLGSNGGPTQTIPLYAGSLAINNGVAIAGIMTDQRGAIRPSGPAPDIGAFEYAFPGELPYWREIHSLPIDGSQDLSMRRVTASPTCSNTPLTWRQMQATGDPKQFHPAGEWQQRLAAHLAERAGAARDRVCAAEGRDEPRHRLRGGDWQRHERPDVPRSDRRIEHFHQFNVGARYGH